MFLIVSRFYVKVIVVVIFDHICHPFSPAFSFHIVFRVAISGCVCMKQLPAFAAATPPRQRQPGQLPAPPQTAHKSLGWLGLPSKAFKSTARCQGAALEACR